MPIPVRQCLCLTPHLASLHCRVQTLHALWRGSVPKLTSGISKCSSGEPPLRHGVLFMD